MSGCGVNVAALGSTPGVLTVLICAPDSDAPTASITITLGSAARIRSRTVGDSGAPPLVKVTRLDRS